MESDTVPMVAVQEADLPTDTIFDREGPVMGLPPEAIAMAKAIILSCPIIRDSQQDLGKSATEMIDAVEELRRAGFVKFTHDPETEALALEMSPMLFGGRPAPRRNSESSRSVRGAVVSKPRRVIAERA